MKLKRQEFQTIRSVLDPHRFVFLDETWVKTNMTRLYGWGPVGQRIVEWVPHGHWKTTTFVAAMRSTGLFAPMVVDGPMNGPTFVAYVQNLLVPELKPDDIVVMDNLTSHKVSGVEQAIVRAGAHVLFLPPYSPDWNPIEGAFSKIKNEIRKQEPRSKADCDDLCGECLDWFDTTMCENFIRHAGYQFQERF